MVLLYGFVVLLAATSGSDVQDKAQPMSIGGQSALIPADFYSPTVPMLACSPGEQEASVEIVFPSDKQKLDIRADFSIGRNLLIRTRTNGFTIKHDGRIMIAINSHGIDPNSTQSRRLKYSRNHNTMEGGGGYSSVMVVQEPNFEIFGLLEGRYVLWATLVDFDLNSRICWKHHHVSFEVGRFALENRSEALLLGLQRIHQDKGRMSDTKARPWLLQPQSHTDFAYVTVLWTIDYVDNVIAWAAGLIASGSTFRRVCMVVKENLWEHLLEMLQRCCCDILPVEPIPSPWKATQGEYSRYELALTKLRVLELGKYGYRKIVLMDSDILVLQNIDELFWFPAPAATVNAATLLGQTDSPYLSTGVMVLEPNEDELKSVIRLLVDWEARAGENDVLRFIEQDLLDMHWSKDGKVQYHVLPLIYNLYPELLDTLPFLAHSDPEAPPRYPLDFGVKLVHFWHWYNPTLAATDRALNTLQIHAKLKHPQMWQWYKLWWDLHQRGLKLAAPEKYHVWLESCHAKYRSIYTEEVAARFMPTVLGHCQHDKGGLEW